VQSVLKQILEVIYKKADILIYLFINE